MLRKRLCRSTARRCKHLIVSVRWMHKYRNEELERVVEKLQLGKPLLTKWWPPASTVAEAKALCDVQTFDLLVSDIGLPDGDGCEVVRYVRQHCAIRAIAISAFGP